MGRAHPSRQPQRQAQADEIKTRWVEASRDRQGAPAVLSGGLSLTPLTLSPKEMALLELREFDEQRIAAAFGVPAYLGEPAAALRLDLHLDAVMLFDFWWRSSLRPLTSNIGAAMSYWLLPRGNWLCFDAAEFVQPPITEQVAALLHADRGPGGHPRRGPLHPPHRPIACNRRAHR